MNKKKISAKPRAASKAPLSPRGEASKKTTQTNADNRSETEKLTEACLALLAEDYEEKICGGHDNLKAINARIQGGARAAREMMEAVKIGSAATVAESLPQHSAKHHLADVLSVFESPHFLERGRYNGEKAPTLEPAWQDFEESWSELLDTMTQRFPAFAARISEVRLTSRKFGDRCDRRNLRLYSAEERARELGAAHEEFEDLEVRIIPLFDEIAARALSDDTKLAALVAFADEVNRRVSKGEQQGEAICSLLNENYANVPALQKIQKSFNAADRNSNFDHIRTKAENSVRQVFKRKGIKLNSRKSNRRKGK